MTGKTAESSSQELHIILHNISRRAIDLKDQEFNKEQVKNKWLGETPCTIVDIEMAEKRLKTVLPEDYKEFVLITNGFQAPISIEPSFEKIDRIEYFTALFPDIIKVIIEWSELPKDKETAYLIERSIVIGGIDDEQQLLIVPPISPEYNWKYIKHASWSVDEYNYESLKDYFEDVFELISSL